MSLGPRLCFITMANQSDLLRPHPDPPASQAKSNWSYKVKRPTVALALSMLQPTYVHSNLGALTMNCCNTVRV